MQFSQSAENKWSESDALSLQTELENLRSAVETAEADRLQYLHDKKAYAELELQIEDAKSEITRLTSCVAQLQEACKAAALQHDGVKQEIENAHIQLISVLDDCNDIKDEYDALLGVVEDLVSKKNILEADIDSARDVLGQQRVIQAAHIAEINALAENITAKNEQLASVRVDLDNVFAERDRMTQRVHESKNAAQALIDAAEAAAEKIKDAALQEKLAFDVEIGKAQQELRAVYEQITAAHEAKERALIARTEAEESLEQVKQAAEEVQKELDERTKILDQRESDIEETRRLALIEVAKQAKQSNSKVEEELIAHLLK